jgi:hypothetical protein
MGTGSFFPHQVQLFVNKTAHLLYSADIKNAGAMPPLLYTLSWFITPVVRTRATLPSPATQLFVSSECFRDSYITQK